MKRRTQSYLLTALLVALSLSWAIFLFYLRIRLDHLKALPKEPENTIKSYEVQEEAITRLKPNASEAFTREFTRAINQSCAAEDRRIGVAIAFVESSFDPQAVSITGDYGLFQFNAAFHKVRNSDDVGTQVSYFCTHIKRLRANYEARFGEWYSLHHSKTPSLRKPYAAKIKKILEVL